MNMDALIKQPYFLREQKFQITEMYKNYKRHQPSCFQLLHRPQSAPCNSILNQVYIHIHVYIYSSGLERSHRLVNYH